MVHFGLVPDEFSDLAEYDAPDIFATRAGFIASRARAPTEPLDAEFEYDRGIDYWWFALVITVTPRP